MTDLSSHVPNDRAQDLRLLVSELVTNAVKYAGLREGERIEVEVWTRPEDVEVKVRYPEHRGFASMLPREPDTASEEDRAPEADEASRWGLLLVDMVSDRWSLVEADGQVLVWAEIELPRPRAA